MEHFKLGGTQVYDPHPNGGSTVRPEFEKPNLNRT